jgi:hypothetical protein
MNTDPRDPGVRATRAEPFIPPSAEQWERLTAMDAILAQVQRHGAETVMGWITDGQGPDWVYGFIDRWGRDRIVRWTRMAANLVGEDV